MDSGGPARQTRSWAAFEADRARFDGPGWRDFSRHLWKTSALSTIAIAGSGATAAAQEGVLWQPQVQTIIGADQQGAYSSLEGFIPLAQTPDSVLFLDLRLKHDFSNGAGGDVGLGFRHVVDPDLILGGYAFLNVDRFDGHQYTGATVGLEAIATNFDAHVNVHLPFGDTSETTSDISSDLSLVGNQLLEQISTIDSRDYASWGIEGEFGVQAPVDLPKDHSLRLHVGGYHFDDVDDIAGSITGGKAGFEYKIGDVFGDSGASVVFGGEIRYDNRDDTHFAGSVRLTIPLGGAERAENDSGPELAYAVSEGLRKRANERVRGDIGVRVDTVESSSSFSRRAINARTGSAFGLFFAADGENTLGLGTLGDPTTLDDAVTRAGVNGFVVALGGSGNLLTEGVTLQNGQTVIGGGQSVQARLFSGATEDFGFGGSDGTIAGTDAATPVVSLANGNTLNGITVTGGGIGIFGNNISGATLTNVTITGAGSHGASFAGTSTGVNASNFASSNNGGSGLSIEGDGTYNFTGTTLLSGNGVDGLNITGDGTYNFQTLNTIDNADDGIDVTSNGGEFTTTAGTVSGNGDVGIIIDPIEADVVLTSIIHDGGTSGVVLDAVSGSFTVTGETTISNTSGPAIAISNSPAEIRFADITIARPGGDGLTFAGANGPVVVGDLVLTELGAGNAGLDFSGSRTIFTAQSVNITGTGAAGSTGIDLSGTLGGSSIIITAGGTIAGVETGVQLGVNGAGAATANANFVFGGGTIAGSNAALDARGLNPLAGTYAFGSTVFNGAQLFDLANLIFVGSTATGAGDGSSVDDLADIDTADANAGSGVVFALVNDGSVINDANGFTLDDGQTLASFGNGRQFALGGVPLNVTGDNVQHGVMQDDPTGLGAATLTNLGTGSTVVLVDGTIIADIGISNGNGESGIFGADVDGATLTGVSLVDAGAAFTGTSTNVSATDFSATGSAGAGLSILGEGSYVFQGSTNLSGNGAEGVAVIGDSDVSFDTLSASGNTASGIFVAGGGAFSFGGLTTLSGNGGAGVFMSNAGDIGFSTLDVQNNAGGGIIAFSDPGGTLSIEGGTVAGNGGSGILLSGGNLDVTLNSVSHTPGGAGAGGIQLSDFGGAFSVTGATTIGASASGGIDIFGSQADISFGGTVAIDSVDRVGLFINESAGTIVFEGAVDIGNAADQGVLVNLFDGELTFNGAVDIHDVGSDGIVIAQSGGRIGFDAPLALDRAGSRGILIVNNSGDVTFGDAAISDSGGNGIDVAGANGAIDFGNIDISGLGAGNTGLDLSGSTSTFTASSLDIAGTGAADSTGIDLSGTVGGSVTITDGGVIQDVDTGVQMGVNGVGGATANTDFVFGGGSIEGLAASLDARGLNPLAGSYAFGTTVFSGPQLFDSSNIIFIGSVATGAGDGSSVNDLAAIGAADANTDGGAVFVLVNDGAAVNDADGFTLENGQTLASFGNGAQYALGGVPLNVTGDNVQHGVIQDDPTGNGAATLTNLGVGDTVVLGDGTIVADINISNGVGGVGIYGVSVDGVALTGVSLIGAGAYFGGTSNTVNATNFSVTGSNSSGLEIQSNGTFVFEGTTVLSGNDDYGLDILGGGDYSFETLNLQNNGEMGLRIFGSSPTANLTITGGTIAGNGSTAASIDGVIVDVMLDSITHDNAASSAAGLVLFGLDGNFAVTGATTIGNVNSIGLSIIGGTADISFDGPVLIDGVATGNGIEVVSSSGIVSFGGAVNISNVARSGIFVEFSDGDVDFNGSVDIADVGDEGISITQSDGPVSFNGATGVSRTGRNGIHILDADAVAFDDVVIIDAGMSGIELFNVSGTVDFGDVVITNPGTSAIEVVFDNATVNFGDIDISGLGAATALNVSGVSNLTFTAASLDITGTNAAGSTGIDLSGTQGGSVTVTNGGTIQDVDTGVQMGTNGAAATTADTDFVFGGGSIEGITASLDMRGLLASSGSYSFGATTFTGPQLFDATDVVFVGRVSTGAGDGSSVNDLINADAADDLGLGPNTTFVLVGTAAADIIDTDVGGFNLAAGQSLVSFANGSTVNLGSPPANVTGTNIATGVTQADPFGFGAPRLRNELGNTIVLDDANVVSNLVVSSSTAAIDGTGSITGFTSSGVTIQGAATGLFLDGALGTISVDNLNIQGPVQSGIVLANMVATVNFTGTTTIAGGSNAALLANNFDGTASFADLDIAGGTGTGIAILNGSGGTLSFAAPSSVSTTGGTAIFVGTSTATVTYNGTITQNSAANAVRINALTGGSVTFGGSITASTGAANAIELTGNAGGTINFTGGLEIDTTTGTGFMASGAGVINVAAAGSQTIETTGGTALNLNGVTLGSVNFDQLSVDDPFAVGSASAVILDGTSGGTLTLGGLVTEGAISDAISISNVVSGVYNFDGTTSVTNTAGGSDAVSIANSAGTFTFADLDASQLTGTALNLDASTASVTVSGGTIAKASAGRVVSATGGDASTLVFDATVTATNGAGLLFDDADGSYGFGGGLVLDDTGFASGIGIDILNGSDGDFTFDDVTITNTAAATALGDDILLGAAAIAIDIYDSAGATTSFGDLDIVSAADIGVAARDGGVVNIGAAGDPSVIDAGFGLVYYDTSGVVANAEITAGTNVPLGGYFIEAAANSSFGFFPLGGQTGISVIAEQVDTSFALSDSTVFGAAGLMNFNFAEQQFALDRNAFSSDGGPGIYISGLFGPGDVFVTSLDSNTMDDGGDVNPDIDEAGFVFEEVVFDADLSNGVIDTVTGGATRIGSAGTRVNNLGLQLTDVTGALSFSDLDIATEGEIAFDVFGAGATPADFALTILDGDIDAQNGQALWLENAELDVTLSSVTSTNAFACCFSTGDGILLTGLAGSFEVTGTTTVTGAEFSGIGIEDNAASIAFGTTTVTDAGVNGILVDGSAGSVAFGTTTIGMTGGPGKTGIDFAGTNTSVTFGATIVSGIGENQTGIDFSDAETTASFGLTTISSPTGSGGSTGIDLSGTLGDRTITFAQGSDIDNLNVGVQLGTAGRGGATANATFTFGDGNSADGLESFITAAAGGFTVDTIGLDPASGTYDFDDVDFTGDANLVVAPDSATFVSQGGGLITVGSFNLSQTINTISLADADALTAAGTIFAFVGPIDVAAAGFDLDAGQSITGFGNGNIVSFGTIQPANVFGDLGATGAAVTGNETTIIGTDTLFTLGGGNEIRHTTFDLSSGVVGSAVFAASTIAAGNDITIEGVTIIGVGQDRIAFDLTDIASDTFIQNNDISIAGTLLDVSGGSGDITITRGTLPNGGLAGTLSAGRVIVDSRVAGSAVTFTDQLTLSSGADDAVLLTGNTGATITFGGGLDITSTTGRGFVATGGGDIAIDAAGVTEIDTNGGMALFLDAVTADVEFDAVNSTSSTTHGILLDTVAGTLTVNGGLLSGANTAGLEIRDSSATFTFANVDVANAAAAGGMGVVISNIGGATVSFTDLDITTTGAGDDGFVVNSAGGTVNVTGNGNSINVGGAQAIDIDGGAGALANVTLDINFDTVNANPAADRSGIELDEISGTFTVLGGTINKTGTAGAAVDIGGVANSSGGNAIVNIGAALNNTGSGRSVLIQQLSGGSVTLSGNINDSGAGLSISSINNGTAATVTLSGASKIFNTGANRAIDLGGSGGNVNGTISFINGGLAITTTTGAGFLAHAGGTINVSGAGNTIATATGTAIDLNGVSIGGNGMNFANVGVNGAATGINLTSVTSAGGGIALGTVNLQNVTSRGVDINTALGAALAIADLDISLNNSAAIAFDLNGAALSAAVTAQDFDVTNAAAAGTSIGIDLRGTTGGQIVRLGDATVANPAFSSIAGVNTGVFLNAATNAAFTFGDGESVTNQQSTISANVGIDATSAPVAGTYNFQDVIFAASPGNGFGVGDIFFVAATATGDGSGRDASNRATLATAEAASGVEDILVLVNDGNFITAAGTNGNDTLILDSGEQVRGFGNGTINLALTVPSTIQLAITNIAIADPTGGGEVTLTTGAGDDAITLGANNNRIDGFILDGNSLIAARGVIDNGVSATGTTISNMTIRNFNSFGIEITPSTNTTISNVTFTGNATDTFLNAAGTTITNVTSTGATGVAFQLDNVSGTTTLTNVSISGALGGGISFGGVTGPAGTINATNVDITNTGTALGIIGGTASFNFDAASSITQGNNAAAVSVSGGHTTGTFSFAGTIGATNGTGLQFDNADGTYNFTGTTTLDGGDAGIDIVGGSGGTFAFGASTTITTPTGTAFAVVGSNANVTYSGSITDNTGFAIDIDNHDAGTITFQTGTITSTGTGLRVQNSNGGTVNFNNQSIQLSTGSAAAVTLAGNAGGTVNFNTGAGLGLDIATTTGTGFSASGGGAVSVLGDGNSISTGAGAALNLSGMTVSGSVNFQSTNKVAGGTSAVILSSVTGSGTINLGTGSLFGGSGAAIRIGDGAGTANTGGTVGLVYSGTITNTTAAGSTNRAIDIQDRAAGAQNITLSGNITHNVAGQTGIFLDDNAAGAITFSGTSKSINSTTETAVNLTDNSGSTINFTNGGLVISTTAGIGFNATGGGTVTVQGTSNTITSTTGTALNVANSTIGASNLTFQSISSNSGGNAGIVLNNTGASGGLTVTGVGATAGSGGTINNKTGNGITLNNTRNVSLSNMIIDNNDGSGVGGTEVTNFSIIGSTVSNNADTATGEEAGLRFTGLYGNSAITNTVFSGSSEDHVRITNSSGVLNNLAVSGSTFNANSAATGGHAIALIGSVTANMALNVTNSSFDDIRGSAVLFHVQDNNLGTANISGSTFTDIGHAVTLQASESADLNFNVLDNTVLRSLSNAVELISGSTSTTTSNIVGRIQDNQIGNGTVDSGVIGGTAVGYGIALDMRGDQDAIIAINGNSVRNTDWEAIWVSSADFGTVENNGLGKLQLTLTNNTAGTPDDNDPSFPLGSVPTVRLEARHDTTLLVNIQNNNFAAGVGGQPGILLRQRNTATFGIQGYGGGAADAAAVEAFLEALNNNPTTVTVQTGAAPTIVNYTNAGVIATPP